MTDALDFILRETGGLDSEATRHAVTRVWRIRLAQSITWTDARGTDHHISTMDPGHRQNIINWLRRHATELHAICVLDTDHATSTPVPGAAHEVLAPMTWLRSTPVWRALVGAQAQHAQEG